MLGCAIAPGTLWAELSAVTLPGNGALAGPSTFTIQEAWVCCGAAVFLQSLHVSVFVGARASGSARTIETKSLLILFRLLGGIRTFAAHVNLVMLVEGVLRAVRQSVLRCTCAG